MIGEQPHTLATPPPPQVCGLMDPAPAWHTTVPPHPSDTVPQLSPEGHCVSGTHAPFPQTFGVPPPPHVCVPGQAPPHDTFPPQPSGIDPQLAPAVQAVAAMQ